MERPIAIAGFMGVGKSSVGRLLAAELSRRFVDTDEEAASIAGRSIDDCFRSGDEAVFREAEAQAVREALSGEAAVIALGGGAVLRDDVRGLLLERALLVFLDVPWDQMQTYLPGMVATRPLLRGRSLEEVRHLYESRLDAYRQAHLHVTVARTSPDDAARRVLEALRLA